MFIYERPLTCRIFQTSKRLLPHTWLQCYCQNEKSLILTEILLENKASCISINLASHLERVNEQQLKDNTKITEIKNNCQHNYHKRIWAKSTHDKSTTKKYSWPSPDVIG